MGPVHKRHAPYTTSTVKLTTRYVEERLKEPLAAAVWVPCYYQEHRESVIPCIRNSIKVIVSKWAVATAVTLRANSVTMATKMLCSQVCKVVSVEALIAAPATTTARPNYHNIVWMVARRPIISGGATAAPAAPPCPILATGLAWALYECIPPAKKEIV
jgi:hypothetical protein